MRHRSSVSPPGSAYFVTGALRALAERPGLDVRAFAVSWRRRGLLAERLPPGVAAAQRPMPARPLHALWSRLDRPPVEWFLGPTDVVHGTNFVVPPTGRAGAVVSVHDLTPLHHPELCDGATLGLPRVDPPGAPAGCLGPYRFGLRRGRGAGGVRRARRTSAGREPRRARGARVDRDGGRRRAGAAVAGRHDALLSSRSAPPSPARTSPGSSAPSPRSRRATTTSSWSWPGPPGWGEVGARRRGGRLAGAAGGSSGPAGSNPGTSPPCSAAPPSWPSPRVTRVSASRRSRPCEPVCPWSPAAPDRCPRCSGTVRCWSSVGDHAALVDALDRCLDDADARAALIAAGSARVALFGGNDVARGSRRSTATWRGARVAERPFAVLVAAEQLRRTVPGGIGSYARGLLAGLVHYAGDVEITLLASRPPGRWGAGGGAERTPGSLRPPRPGVEAARPAPDEGVGLWPAPCPDRLRGGALGVARGAVAPEPRRGRTRRDLPRPGVAPAPAGHDQPRATVARGCPPAGPRGRGFVRRPLPDRSQPTFRPTESRSAASPSSGAVRTTWSTPDEEATAELLARLGVEGEYLLSVGTLEPRKNVERMVRAYRRRQPRSGRADGRCVVVRTPGLGSASRPSPAPRVRLLHRRGVRRRTGRSLPGEPGLRLRASDGGVRATAARSHAQRRAHRGLAPGPERARPRRRGCSAGPARRPARRRRHGAGHP